MSADSAKRHVVQVAPLSRDRASHTPCGFTQNEYSAPVASQARGSVHRGVVLRFVLVGQSRVPGAEYFLQFTPASALTAIESTPSSNLFPDAAIGVIRTATS